MFAQRRLWVPAGVRGSGTITGPGGSWGTGSGSGTTGVMLAASFSSHSARRNRACRIAGRAGPPTRTPRRLTSSQARRRIGVPVLHLLEHESFDEQAGGGEGDSGV